VSLVLRTGVLFAALFPASPGVVLHLLVWLATEWMVPAHCLQPVCDDSEVATPRSELQPRRWGGGGGEASWSLGSSLCSPSLASRPIRTQLREVRSSDRRQNGKIYDDGSRR
jgi:hypothetical protein